MTRNPFAQTSEYIYDSHVALCGICMEVQSLPAHVVGDGGGCGAVTAVVVAVVVIVTFGPNTLLMCNGNVVV